jgi:hypothetical protein
VLFLNLFLNLSVSLVSLNQVFDSAFNFRQVLCIIYSTTIVIDWFLTYNSIWNVFLIFVFRRTYRSNCLVWTDLFFLVFLFGFVFRWKILFVLTGKILDMTGSKNFLIFSWVLVFFLIIWSLLILIVSILFAVFFMEGAAVSIIKFNFRFCKDEDFLRWYWNYLCDFGSDLSFLRRTKESVVLDISHIVMCFWGFGLLMR